MWEYLASMREAGQATRPVWPWRRALRHATPYFFIAPWVLGVLIFFAYPILASFYFSFHNYDVLRPPVWVGLRNYIDLVQNAYSRQALGNTLTYVIVAVPCGLLVGLIYAMLLNVNVRGQQVFRTLMLAPGAVPVAAGAAVWFVIWNPAFGLLNGLLGTLGPSVRQSWLVSPAMVKWVFITMQIIHGMGMLVFLAGLQGIPPEVYDAASVDGAVGLRRLVSITIPMLTPYVLYNLLISMIGAFQYFAFPMLMTGGGPVGGSTFYGQYLYDQAFNFFKMGYASALAWILFLICLLAVVVIMRSSARWVHYTGGE